MEDKFTPYNITSKQVSHVMDIDIRTAQDILKDTRQKLGKLKNAYVSVHEFCTEYHLPEEEVLKTLKRMAPDAH
jgi:3-dehydroquinate dehydratase